MASEPAVKSREEKDRELREWKRDIQRRCAEHLKKFPDKPKENSSRITSFNKSRTVRIYVLESTMTPGTWHVYRNGERVMTFLGERAHQNATKFAGDLCGDL